MITKLSLKGSVLTVNDTKYDLEPNASDDLNSPGYDELRYWQDTRNNQQVQHCHLFNHNQIGPALPCENMGEVSMVENLVLPYFKARGG